MLWVYWLHPWNKNYDNQMASLAFATWLYYGIVRVVLQIYICFYLGRFSASKNRYFENQCPTFKKDANLRLLLHPFWYEVSNEFPHLFLQLRNLRTFGVGTIGRRRLWKHILRRFCESTNRGMIATFHWNYRNPKVIIYMDGIWNDYKTLQKKSFKLPSDRSNVFGNCSPKTIRIIE